MQIKITGVPTTTTSHNLSEIWDILMKNPPFFVPGTRVLLSPEIPQLSGTQQLFG
jgi:hypothetical protein